MLSWYVLHTKPHAESLVARVLVARGFETFLPLLPTPLAEPIQPLFPAYLFVHCDFELVSVERLLWIPGLRRIIAFGGRPAVVPETAIALIRSQLAQIEAQGGLPSHNFKPGDTVIIDEGPLAGLRGIFQGPLGPAERVHILIRFLGQVNRAEVPVSVLRAAPAEPVRLPRQRGTRGHGRRIRYQDGQPGEEEVATVPDLL